MRIYIFKVRDKERVARIRRRSGGKQAPAKSRPWTATGVVGAIGLLPTSSRVMRSKKQSAAQASSSGA